jgi:hypothetical protein
MTHLSPGQIVDIAEGCAGAGLAAHVRHCASCRSRVESVRDALRIAQSDPPPAPSSLFWRHLAARIGEAVRHERVHAPLWRDWGWRLAPIGAVAVLVIAVGVGARMWSWMPGCDSPASGSRAEATVQAPDEPMTEGEPADDPAWTLVSDLSAALSVEDAEASGVLPPPGGADKALLQLDDAERLELARILREEIGTRSGLEPYGPGA